MLSGLTLTFCVEVRDIWWMGTSVLLCLITSDFGQPRWPNRPVGVDCVNVFRLCHESFAVLDCILSVADAQLFHLCDAGVFEDSDVVSEIGNTVLIL